MGLVSRQKEPLKQTAQERQEWDEVEGSPWSGDYIPHSLLDALSVAFILFKAKGRRDGVLSETKNIGNPFKVFLFTYCIPHTCI